jgi:hypothetical protein
MSNDYKPQRPAVSQPGDDELFRVEYVNVVPGTALYDKILESKLMLLKDTLADRRRRQRRVAAGLPEEEPTPPRVIGKNWFPRNQLSDEGWRQLRRQVGTPLVEYVLPPDLQRLEDRIDRLCGPIKDEAAPLPLSLPSNQ